MAARRDRWLERVPSPREETLRRRWKAASQGRVQPAPAPEDGSPPRWQLPSCALRYELSSWNIAENATPDGSAKSQAQSRAGVGRGREATTRVAFSLNPDSDSVTLQVVDAVTTVNAEGVPSTPTAHAVHDWALPQLTTDGRRWRERQGPTTVWSAYASVPALQGQFPVLPTSGAVGARMAWPLEIQPVGVTRDVEDRRARGVGGGEVVAPIRRTRDLRLAGYLFVDGVRAAALEAQWDTVVDVSSPRRFLRAERWLGRFIVLLSSGRLLYAISRGRSWQELDSHDAIETTGRGEIELRLVEACDGPTLPGGRTSARPPDG